MSFTNLNPVAVEIGKNATIRLYTTKRVRWWWKPWTWRRTPVVGEFPVTVEPASKGQTTITWKSVWTAERDGDLLIAAREEDNA